MSYIDLRVFPTSGRTDTEEIGIDTGTNLVTEYNLASILNNITHGASFVITGGDNPGDIDYEDINYLEFVIYGYYFRLRNFYITDDESYNTQYVKIIKDDDTIKALISIKKANQDSYNYLIPLSSENEWNSTTSDRYPKNPSNPEDPDSYLILLKKVKVGETSYKWIIPKESRYIFKGYTLTDLDEGEI